MRDLKIISAQAERWRHTLTGNWLKTFLTKILCYEASSTLFCQLVGLSFFTIGYILVRVFDFHNDILACKRNWKRVDNLTLPCLLVRHLLAANCSPSTLLLSLLSQMITTEI